MKVSPSSDKSQWMYQARIDACHPEEAPTGSDWEALVFAADALAMTLVHERYDKRDLVNLVRWLILRSPEGLIS